MEKQVGQLTLSTRLFFDEPFEIQYGQRLHDAELYDYIPNVSFVGLLGIGGNVWWFTNEEEAMRSCDQLLLLVEHFRERIERIVHELEL